MKKICPITQIMEVLSKKWTLLILKNLNQDKGIRFNELQKEMSHISPRTLSKRLKELQKENLIDKKHFNEIPPRVDYFLTPKGKELMKCFTTLDSWAIKWDTK